MYQLSISEGFETLSINHGMDFNTEVGKLSNLGVLDSFLRAFSPLCQQSAQEALSNIQLVNINTALKVFKNDMLPPASQEQKSTVRVKPYCPKLGDWDPLFGHYIEEDWDAFWLYIEYICLYQTVIDWLVPTRKLSTSRYFFTPEERFAQTSFHQPVENIQMPWAQQLTANRLPQFEMGSNDAIDVLAANMSNMSFIIEIHPERAHELKKWYPLIIKQYQEEYFRHRTRQVGVEMLVVENNGRPGLSRLYSADEPLSLAWAEIMWAIDQGKYAHLCEVCGGVFILNRPYQRIAYTCSPNCAKQQRTMRMGGPEELRKYNREAKQRQRKKPVT